MNKVAVILPVYHRDKVDYIQLSVESILQQTYECIKIFIGVDGPIGQDMESCLNEYGRNERIQVVWFNENRGLACVLNDLLEMCFKEGFEFIARMDADDISQIDRIEKQMSFLNKHPEIDVVGGAVEQIDSEGRSIGFIKKFPLTHEDCYKRFSRRNPLSHPAVLFKKVFFEKAQTTYRSEYRTNQDTLLWYDGLLGGIKMANLPDVVLRFRITDSMLTKRRGGWEKAKKQLKARLMINKGLKYGFKADIYAMLVFIYMISPLFIKKFWFYWI